MKRSPDTTRLGTLSFLPLALGLGLGLGLVGAGCGSPPPPQQAGVEGLAPTADPGATPAPTADASGPGQAHALLLQAAGCWYGGLWSDAEGAAPEERRAAAERRCAALEKRLYGAEDKVRYDRLRLIDPTVVDLLASEIDKLASHDAVDGAHKEALGRLLRALAAAQRENNDAHIAADTVKADLKSQTEPETLSKDEAIAVPPLRAHAGLQALLALDAQDLGAEAHTMGLLCAMDRLELSRALPRHLKVYAVGDALQLVFGVAPPQVPSDPTAKLVPGTWLTYVTAVAAAAGHAVPATATSPRERDPWAWGGVIAGFGDRLRADAAKLGAGGGFARVAGALVKKLDAEWAEIPEIAARQKAMGDREAKEREGKDKPKK